MAEKVTKNLPAVGMLYFFPIVGRAFLISTMISRAWSVQSASFLLTAVMA